MSDLKERLDALIRTEQTGSRKLMQVGIDALARIEQLEAQIKAASEALDQFRGVCLAWNDCEDITGSIDLEPIRAAFAVIDTATTGAKTP
jgi:hypothetical protein